MSQEPADVLIVVALRQELDAVLDRGAGGRSAWREARESSGATYHVRDHENRLGQRMRIAAAWLGDSGQAAATARSRRLIDELDPACVALCGLCAGLRGRVQLGDVIVAERVIDLGGIELDETGDDDPQRWSNVYELDLPWKMHAAALADDAEWRAPLSRVRPPTSESQARWILRALLEQESGGVAAAEHPERRRFCPDWAGTVRRLLDDGQAQIGPAGALALTPRARKEAAEEKILHPDGSAGDPPFRVHLGTLATAERVIRDPSVPERWSSRVRKLLGVDLESSAVASVATRLERRWIVVRAVADHADSSRDDSFHDFACEASAAFLWTFLDRYFDVGARAKPPSDRPLDQVLEPVLVEQVTIAGFKNISRLVIDMTAPSRLGGHWTCLAGINGSGKTSILQAIALVLLGDKLAEQLGSVRLGRMVQRVGEAAGHAEIEARVRIGAEVHTLLLPLTAEGIDPARLAAHPGRKEMRALWDRRARRGILAAYGASRNLSEYVDNRHEALHPEVQRQMTLFDPQARVVRAEMLLSEGSSVAPVIRTLRRVLDVLLADLPIRVAEGEDALRFEIDGAVLPASALPDGFRSTVAWLGDLCALWHDKARPEEIEDGDPGHIHGIVLVDEIDLHLHPSLQRVLVPRLRKAMPRVQWIVTTHSPLVLASFDRRELKMLDSAEPGGVRELDRDVLGFTTDQIYEWLMYTRPRGVVLEELLARAEDPGLDPARREEIAVLVATAPDFNEEDARRRVAWRERLLSRLHEGAAPDTEKTG